MKVVRPARDEDAQDLFGLLALCFAEYPGCYIDPHEDLADLRAPARAFPQPGAFWVVEDGRGRVSACVAFDMPASDTAELNRLYVRPDARRGGLGAHLVRIVEDAGRERGGAQMVLWSDTRFTDAHRLYERLGYRPTGDARELGDISRSRELRFEKALLQAASGDAS
jgi:putative acetyltransferase